MSAAKAIALVMFATASMGQAPVKPLAESPPTGSAARGQTLVEGKGTASDLLFTGVSEGYFMALDARSGTLVWKAMLGGNIVMGPMSYAVAGKQYVAVAAGNSLFVYGLR
jgi:outer membrane protein assembly factor BamB